MSIFEDIIGVQEKLTLSVTRITPFSNVKLGILSIYLTC